MTALYILAAIALAGAIHYIKSNWKRWKYAKDLEFPSASKRGDLSYGYFGCILEQVAETKGHVNILNEVQFEAPDKVAKNMRDANMDVMLGLSPQLLDRPDAKTQFTVRPDAEQRLYDFFTFLRLEGVLHHVVAMTPIDEPNNTVGSEAELLKVVAVIRRVADQFIELAGYKLYVIYAADKSFIAQSAFDWIGFDDYDMKSHVLVGEKYKALKASLRPDQHTIIIPGGCYGQDPKPFVDFAQGNQEVAVVLPFLWLDDQWGTVGAPGIRSNGLRAKYITAGKSII